MLVHRSLHLHMARPPSSRWGRSTPPSQRVLVKSQAICVACDLRLHSDRLLVIPVMEEVRIQVSAEHRTRIRLWKSPDPSVSCRLEFGHRIGVLDKMTEVASRFTSGDLASGSEFVVSTQSNGVAFGLGQSSSGMYFQITKCACLF